MNLSRREFVRLGSMCAFSASLSLGFINQALGQKRSGASDKTGSDFTIPLEAQRDPLFFMTERTFSQYVETKFIIDPGFTFPIETTLVEVMDLRSATARKKNILGQECFLLKFQINGENSTGQGTYQVKHDALGTFELFVVPSKDSEGRLYLEAVINRITE
jgi:hypothetical protein